MTQLTKHFKREEFQCSCGCGFATVDIELIEVLEDLRNTYATPIKINSGCRCLLHNMTVGGEPHSKHTQGIAADINVVGVSPAKVVQYLTGKYPDKYGIGEYASWVHIDVRPNKARWKK